MPFTHHLALGRFLKFLAATLFHKVSVHTAGPASVKALRSAGFLPAPTSVCSLVKFYSRLYLELEKTLWSSKDVKNFFSSFILREKDTA